MTHASNSTIDGGDGGQAEELKHELADLPLDHPNRPGLEHMARLECSPQARGCSGNEFRAYFVLYGVPRRRGDVPIISGLSS